MAKEIRNIRLICSPFHSSVEVAGNLVISFCSIACTPSLFRLALDSVIIKVNPFIADYKNKAAEDILRMMLEEDTTDTLTLQFDFKRNKSQIAQIGDNKYEIKLMNVGTIKEKGQGFPVLGFLITEL
jgi:hypothetical protein